MIEAPLPPDEEARLLALDSYKLFGTAPEIGFDRITALASRTLGVPMVFITLVGTDAQWLKSACGLQGVCQTPRSVAFCAHTILGDDFLVVPDATQDPRFWDNPLVTGPMHLRFYAGHPLKTPSGHNIGALCLLDTEPREATPEMLANLKDLSAFVVDQLELRKNLIEEEARGRLEAETNYRRLADSINGMVFRIKPSSPAQYVPLYVSPGCSDLLECTPEEYCDSLRASASFVHPDEREAFHEMTEASRRERGEWIWSGRVVTARGTEKWVRAEGRWELDAEGEDILEGLVIDISEMKRREAALSAAVEFAEQASQAKSEFLSRMSHELRTPMNAILGFAQILEMESIPTEAQEDLAQIKKAGEHLLGLINEVLDLSAVGARQVATVIEPVPLAELLSDTVALIRPLLDRYGVRVPVVGGAEGHCVLADRHRLKQVMINLVTNAVKYNRPGGHVRIEVRSEADRISIGVSDQGHGIAPEAMARLFQPFDRLGAEATEIEGSGLGLCISHGLVELMGGELAAESVVGQGSTFTVRLPFVGCDHPSMCPVPPQSGEAVRDSGGREILYIEDNASNILLVRRVLGRRPNVGLATVGTVAAGLQRLADAPPDLLLLDLNLPDGSGEEIIRWVRTESSLTKLPIIVLSADAMPHQAQQVLAVGADHYLTKPLQLNTFLQTLDAAIAEVRP